GVLVAAFGFAAWVIPFELASATVRLFRGRRAVLGVTTVVSTLVIVLIGCGLLHLVLNGEEIYGGHLPGGVLGEVLGEVLRSLLGEAGAYVVGVTVLLITLVLRTPVSITDTFRRGVQWLRESASRASDGLHTVADAWREARELEQAERDAERDDPRIVDEHADDEDDDEYEDDEYEDDEEYEDEEYEDEEYEDDEEEFDEEDDEEEWEDEDEVEEPAPTPKAKAPAPKAPAKKQAGGPKIVAPRDTTQKPKAPTERTRPQTNGKPFELPSLDLLDSSYGGRIRVDTTVLRENALRLTEKLESYGVKGRVDEIHPGPVVTMYEFEPKSGTKISKIAGLENDLALALAAQKVRIVAPIPGKARVGIELPNEDRQTVYLREILEDERWEKHKAALPIALGKDIAGQPVYGDLAKMPHLLVAGATGSGKSVGLNVMLASLLFKKTPEEVKFLMIDPKVVELAVFDGIPHMLLPVVTDMKKAALSLKWAVDEMERRYQLFADAGARSISTYNKRVDKVIAGDLPIEKLMPSKAGKVRGVDEKGNEVFHDATDGESPSELVPEKLPYVVVVVDEFADLMMVAAKDVEACIARLAQKARAAGIHVILATQRPSVDVITGMIKANFPARMAFKVSQREDSKTILGRVGAQNLLGRGDMLMIPPGSSELQRVHSAFISEEEVAETCDALRAQGKPVYDQNILKPRDDDGGPGAKTDDPLYDKAVAIVAQAQYCSISHLQRQLSIGYNKAAKLVEKMEKEGVVGPASRKAGGRREVLIQPI
ncbi:MAG: DNA translocase FtsK 4TM domain-containing protein, partial [Myxococcota bacterium]